jgi:1-phosphofructokinase family hexose kinase
VIYTVTLNPSLDRTMAFAGLAVGDLNRATRSRVDLSGKGVNVSLGLRQLGIESVIMGLAAGAFGRVLVDGLRGLGYACDFIMVEGETRSNITIVDETSGETTKLNEPGPTVTADDLAAFEARLRARVQAGDTCVLSGSLPPGAPVDTYARLVEVIQVCGGLAVLDTSGPALAAGCAAGPDLLKPNLVEAQELVSCAFDEPGEMLRGLRAIRALGARRVLISLGSRGAAYDDGESVWWAEPPRITEVNAVGAGDSLTAAAVWAWSGGEAPAELLRWAVACGTAAAMQDGTSVPTAERVSEVYARVRLNAL